MSRPTFFGTLTLVALALAPSQFAAAQQAVPPAPPAGAQEQGWYYGPTTPTVETRSIAQQKAQLRAKQRMARLEALRRYGLTPNRPPSVALPFTSVHTLSWMRSGRSPFIYYRSDRPLVYYSYPNRFYR
jgi:hypothetical protein